MEPFDSVDVKNTSPEWYQDCMHWRGRVLTGKYAHWCNDWDGLPIDETCEEWPCVCEEHLRQSRGPSPPGTAEGE